MHIYLTEHCKEQLIKALKESTEDQNKIIDPHIKKYGWFLGRFIPLLIGFFNKNNLNNLGEK